MKGKVYKDYCSEAMIDGSSVVPNKKGEVVCMDKEEIMESDRAFLRMMKEVAGKDYVLKPIDDGLKPNYQVIRKRQCT